MSSVNLVELWRGPFLESRHTGHMVVCGEDGSVEQAWGDPARITLARSSIKILQALPLMRSGAAANLSSEQLALCCASHDGAAIHTERVARWLADLGLGEADLRCGPQEPDNRPARDGLILAGEQPCQIHNNCSGKHAGFVTLNRHLGAGPEYVEVDHPLQRMIREAFEDSVGEDSPGYGIDGCSAPNFASSLAGIGRAMAKCAVAAADSAEGQLRDAMMAHPALVAGEGRACTGLMRAMAGKGAVKTGAEGMFIAILPGLKKSVVLKIEDGTTRAAEAAMAAVLVHLGVLEAGDPAVLARVGGPILNRRGVDTGTTRMAPGVF
ncbi:MAG: L-asparaginase II [Paracoccaceae bacterium]|jgi:L-asparaginase II